VLELLIKQKLGNIVHTFNTPHRDYTSNLNTSFLQATQSC